MTDQNKAIGIFDSGVGGLTVMRSIIRRLPKESIIYLGDTARVPYGTKSPETIARYASACTNILLERGIKLLVVACNTASAYALEDLRERLDIPVLGVVEPGALAAAKHSQNGHIGIIGTVGTIRSQAYNDAILARRPDAQLYTQPCPLFVPLAEEGWTDGAIPEAIAETYLEDLLTNNIDTLVLGCTHSPLLTDVIAKTTGSTVTLIESATETAITVEETLVSMGLLAEQTFQPQYRFLVSDAPEGIAPIGERFLGQRLGEIEWVDF
jgi:glutamate racemase